MTNPSQAEAFTEQIAVLEEQREHLTTAFKSDEITSADYRDQNAKLKFEIASLREAQAKEEASQEQAPDRTVTYERSRDIAHG